MGAALAFYTVLSMVPLLLIVITIAGFILWRGCRTWRAVRQDRRHGRRKRDPGGAGEHRQFRQRIDVDRGGIVTLLVGVTTVPA